MRFKNKYHSNFTLNSLVLYTFSFIFTYLILYPLKNQKKPLIYPLIPCKL